MFFIKYSLRTGFLAYSPAESLIPKITVNINQCVTDSYLNLPLFDGKSLNSYSNFWEVLGIIFFGFMKHEESFYDCGTHPVNSMPVSIPDHSWQHH